jgi:hypothetical protein
MLDRVCRAVKRVLPVDDRRDFPRLRILGDIGIRMGGHDEHARAIDSPSFRT